MTRLLLAAVAALALVAPAPAAVVFSQPVTSNPPNFRTSDFVTQQNADNFSLASVTSVTAVRWWGSWFSDLALGEQYTIRFFADVAGSPATTPFAAFTGQLPTVTPTAFTVTAPGFSTEMVRQYDLVLPSAVALNAATTYYLSVLSETSNTAGTENWRWILITGGGSRWFRGGTSTGAWSATSTASGQFGFQLFDDPVAAVPEPGTLAVFGLLAVGGLAVRRRKA